MEAPIKIPITPELLLDLGFERVEGKKEMLFRTDEVQLQLADDGKTAAWLGHKPVFEYWEEFLEQYRNENGEDFEPTNNPLRDSIEYEWH
jgi:hypothetical protein